MSRLTEKHILLGVSGGIAAYKSPDLVRRLRERGADVQVVMTQGAQQFITPLTLQAVSGHAIHTALLDADAESAFGHIDLARWADAVLVAPATAHFLAKLTHGMADDLLSTVCLATTAQICVAPAMNRIMWQAPATQANCETLLRRGIHIFGPGAGAQACGETGEGRMREPLELIADLEYLFQPKVMDGLRVMVTAGPTREDIDPVRYITNRSSGRMGYALAEAAYLAGASVTLVSGPTSLAPPIGVNIVPVHSAQNMLDAVLSHIDSVDIFIANAAVADYTPTERATQKLKKSDEDMEIALARTTDILKHVAGRENGPFTVGFAAETQNVAQYAKGKLEKKKLDMIAANDVSDKSIGFDSDENAVTVFWRDGSRIFPRCSKAVLAQQLVELIAKRYQR